MVEKSRQTAEEEKFPESVNTPVIAQMNLSKVFLDPEIGQAFTMTKIEFKEEYLERSGYWGESKIRTIDDLQLELDNDAAKDYDDEDGVDVRDDFSSDDDGIAG